MSTTSNPSTTGTGRPTRRSKDELHALRLAEMAAICDTLAGYDDADWNHDTYCTGWRVRDVVGHMLIGYTTPMPTMLRKLAATRFDVDRASAEESVAYGSSHSPDELLAELRQVQAGNVRKGISKVIAPSEGVVDHTIHHLDITRPLGRPATTGPATREAALDAIVTLGGFVRAKARAKGFAFRATDLDWGWGDGPTVIGPSEDLLLALSGRPAGLDALAGEGLEALRTRL